MPLCGSSMQAPFFHAKIKPTIARQTYSRQAKHTLTTNAVDTSFVASMWSAHDITVLYVAVWEKLQILWSYSRHQRCCTLGLIACPSLHWCDLVPHRCNRPVCCFVCQRLQVLSIRSDWIERRSRKQVCVAAQYSK